MRVILIDVCYNQGSTGKIISDLGSCLGEDGHLVRYIYGRGKKSKEINAIKVTSFFEVIVHVLLTRLIGLTGGFSRNATRKALRLISKFKPDVVHLHDLHGYYINIYKIIKYLKARRIKTVWTFHCEFMYTGKCGHAYDCEKWKTRCNKCPRLREYPTSWLLDFTSYMHAKKQRLFKGWDNVTIATPSQWLVNRVKQSFLSDKDTYVINNGIDTDGVFYPRDTSRLKNIHKLSKRHVVLAVAQDLMSDIKGGKYILKLAELMPKNEYLFIMIGINDVFNVADNIIMLPRTNNQNELAEYYSLASVFVICSERENFPTVCVEALSCGTPVCGFLGGGTAETAPDGLGIFVPHGDIESLRDAVINLISRGSGLRDQCREYSEQHYSKLAMYRSYLDVYNKVI